MKKSSTLVTLVVATTFFVGLPFASATIDLRSADDTPRLTDTLRLECRVTFR